MSPSAAEARRALARRLAAAGIDAPDLEARLLVRHASGIDPALPGAADRPVDDAAAACLEAAVRRRLGREPVERILGAREFFGRPFVLNAASLSPRPDTEAVAEAALALLPGEAGASVLDLGTGPGTLLLTLLAERPRAWGLGIDRSAQALAAARTNAAALGVADRALFAAADWSAPLAGGFDLIVANPPYIASADCERLEPEVRDHDPRLALDGGADGLAAYRAILADAPRLLAPGGHVVLELGYGQACAVAAIAASCGLAVAGLRSDLSAVPRALVLRPS